MASPAQTDPVGRSALSRGAKPPRAVMSAGAGLFRASRLVSWLPFVRDGALAPRQVCGCYWIWPGQ
jgi:hypothetical protein